MLVAGLVPRQVTFDLLIGPGPDRRIRGEVALGSARHCTSACTPAIASPCPSAGLVIGAVEREVAKIAHFDAGRTGRPYCCGAKA
jgi:hypothetical protein